MCGAFTLRLLQAFLCFDMKVAFVLWKFSFLLGGQILSSEHGSAVCVWRSVPLCFFNRVIDKLFFRVQRKRRRRRKSAFFLNTKDLSFIFFFFLRFLVSPYLFPSSFYSWPPSGNNICSWKQTISNFREELHVCVRACVGVCIVCVHVWMLERGH